MRTNSPQKMWAGLFLWNNGTATGWCGWKVSHLKHPLPSPQCQWDHITLTEKQVSHDDLVVVNNKANLLPDFTLKRQKDALPKWAFSTAKTDWNLIYSVHINHSYIFHTWQYVSRIAPSFSGQPQC